MLNIRVDLDDVLVDLNSATQRALNLPERLQYVRQYGDLVAHMASQTQDELVDWFQQQPVSFWTSLKPFPWTRRMLKLIETHDPNFRIVSISVRSANAWAGKYALVKQCFGEAAASRLIVLGQDKAGICRGPADVLVDDYPANCRDWGKAGGAAFHWCSYSPDWLERGEEQVDGLGHWLRDYANSRTS